MHVVGFGVQGAASDQLACIAREGGGTYAEAADAGKLKDALAGALEKTLPENLIIRAVQVSSSNPDMQTPLDAVVGVSENGQRIAELSGTRAGFKLDPGVYDIDVSIPSLQMSRTLESIAVSADTKTEKEVPFTVSAIGVKAFDSAQMPIEVSVKIFKQGDESVSAEGWSGAESPYLFALPPATYRLELTEPATHQARVLDDVVLNEGEERVTEVSFAMAKLGIRGVDAEGNAITVHVTVDRPGDTRNHVADDWSNAGRDHFFDLPPGTYNVTVSETRSSQTLHIEAIELTPGAEIVKEVSFAVARLGIRGVDSQGNPITVHVTVDRPGDTRNHVASDWSNAGRDHFFDLSPGTYDVTVEESRSHQKIELKAMVLEAGTEVIREVAF